MDEQRDVSSNDDLRSLKSEIRSLFSSLSLEVDKRFSALEATISEIKTQNEEMKDSLNFLSEKYDSMLAQMQTLENEKKRDREHIIQLENKLEILERKSRASGVEIRNVPKNISDKFETKHDLSQLVKNLCTTLKIELQEADIRDIYRVHSNKEAIKPIVLELSSVLVKEKLISAVKNYNKNKKTESKLSTVSLNIAGPTRPIYVSELLTFKAQKLFFQAREFAKLKEYNYCWTSKGVVYLRKTENTPLVRIGSEEDLEKLKNIV